MNIGNLLERKIKKTISIEGEGDIFIYYPNQNEIDSINEIIKECESNVETENGIKSNIDMSFSDIALGIIPKITSLKGMEDLDELQLQGLQKNPPYYIKLVINEVRDIIQDIKSLQFKEAELENKKAINMVNELIAMFDNLNMTDLQMNRLPNEEQMKEYLDKAEGLLRKSGDTKNLEVIKGLKKDINKGLHNKPKLKVVDDIKIDIDKVHKEAIEMNLEYNTALNYLVKLGMEDKIKETPIYKKVNNIK